LKLIGFIIKKIKDAKRSSLSGHGKRYVAPENNLAAANTTCCAVQNINALYIVYQSRKKKIMVNIIRNG
jgi:hypothetical protein